MLSWCPLIELQAASILKLGGVVEDRRRDAHNCTLLQVGDDELPTIKSGTYHACTPGQLSSRHGPCLKCLAYAVGLGEMEARFGARAHGLGVSFGTGAHASENLGKIFLRTEE